MARTDEIIAFTTIVDLGTFSAAASHLHLTPAAVSRRIKSLEERLGVELLERTTRTAMLTEAGEHYNQRVRSVLDSMIQLEDEVQNITGKPAGKIKISAPPAFTEKVLSDLLHSFSMQYPEIKLEIMTSLDWVDLDYEGCDLGFWLSESHNPSHISTSVSPVKFNVVASPKYLNSKPPLRSLLDISSHNCLLFTAQARKGSWVLTHREESHRINISGNLITNSSSVLLQGALNGQGLAYIPDFLYEPYVNKGELQLILPEALQETKALYAIIPESMAASRKVLMFIDFVKEYLNKEKSDSK